MDRYVLSLDIGGTHTRIGLVDERYGLTDFEIVKTKEIQKAGNTVDNFVAVLRAYWKEHGAGCTIAAISAGFPSTIDRERRTVLSTPNISGFNNIAIAERLEQEFSVPAYIETDVNMLLLFDMMENHIPEEGITCGIYFGTGLGNAVAVDGKLLVGKTGASTELGHIPVRGIDGVCGCGNSSCIELIASGYHLQDLCEERFPDTEIGEIFTKHGSSPEILRFIDDLSLAAATEINILDPNYIIIGGGLTSMPNFPFAQLEADIYRYARKPFPAEELSYIYSRQGQENGVIGAGILGFRKLKEIEKRGDDTI